MTHKSVFFLYTQCACLFTLVFLFPFRSIHPNQEPQLIIWHVGQGQMITYSSIYSCLHFDMGGEFLPINKLIKECGHKKNKVFFSHWDWDHINFTRKVWKALSSLCRINWPHGAGNSKRKKFLSIVPECQKADTSDFKEIHFPAHLNNTRKVSESNKYSRVIILKNRVLIPGDSPGTSEHLWMDKIKDPIKILVLSHHGSRFSTTNRLLKKLKHLRIAVASARKKRYGHPHPLVKKRLKNIGVPLISTEHFNHIRFPLH